MDEFHQKINDLMTVTCKEGLSWVLESRAFLEAAFNLKITIKSRQLINYLNDVRSIKGLGALSFAKPLAMAVR